jgi:aryl-alcohol dehydrogenase-like predicted oxidoreductase
MDTRTLGDSDLVLSRLGCAIGRSGGDAACGVQGEADAIAAILKALELGVNWIDAAAVDGLLRSEMIVARALVAQWRGDRPYVFTGCSVRRNTARQIRPGFAAQSIRAACEGSLRRLRIDAIDVYQLQCPPVDEGALDEAWEAMARLQREGKVRWIGIADAAVAQIRRADAVAAVTSLRAACSPIRSTVDTTAVAHCRRHGIGVIASASIESGPVSERQALIERLESIGARRGRRPGEIAIAWVLSNPSITGAIAAVRSVRQTERVVGAADLTLTRDEIEEMEGAVPLTTR